MTTMPTFPVRRTPRVAALTAVGALVLAAVPAAAAQATPGDLTVTYDAVGSTHIAKTNSDIPVGPTQLTATVRPDGSVIGSLLPPPQRTSFKVLGFVPVSATVTFIPVGGKRQVTGTLTAGKVKTKAKFLIQLSDVTVAGLPAFVGDDCRTAETVVVPAVTPKGERFSITDGGNLVGTYAVGSFTDCGFTTPILNLLVPGEGNTLAIAISNGRIGGGGGA